MIYMYIYICPHVTYGAAYLSIEKFSLKKLKEKLGNDTAIMKVQGHQE